MKNKQTLLRLFFGGSLLLLLLTYFLAIKKTIDLNKDINQVKLELKKGKNIDQNISFLEQELANINSKDHYVSWENYNKILLEKTTTIATEEGVEISFFEPYISKEYKNFTSFGYKTKFIGDYIQLVKTLKRIEAEKNIGEVLSVDYVVNTIQDRERKKYLEMVVYMHYLKSKS
jgi:hypothetical protein